MLGAIVLAITMLVYNPIQQALLLNQVKQIVIENNELLLNQSAEIANVSHHDQLQRQTEHQAILSNITQLIHSHDEQSGVNTQYVNSAIKNQTADIINKIDNLLTLRANGNKNNHTGNSTIP